MSPILKNLSAVAGAAFLFVSAVPAHAEPVTAKFTYLHDLSVEENYKRFQATALRACEMGSVLKIKAKEIQQQCTADMLDQVVVAMERPELAAVHAAETANAKKTRRGFLARLAGGER